MATRDLVRVQALNRNLRRVSPVVLGVSNVQGDGFPNIPSKHELQGYRVVPAITMTAGRWELLLSQF